MAKKKSAAEIEEFLLKIICEVDYDIYKEFKFPEDPEYAAEVGTMGKLVAMTQEFIEGE
jgi:hypothetical protein